MEVNIWASHISQKRIDFYSYYFIPLSNLYYKNGYLCSVFAVCDLRAALPLLYNYNWNLQASVRHAKIDKHAVVYLMSCWYSLPSSVLLSLGIMAAPQGEGPCVLCGLKSSCLVRWTLQGLWVHPPGYMCVHCTAIWPLLVLMSTFLFPQSFFPVSLVGSNVLSKWITKIT